MWIHDSSLLRSGEQAFPDPPEASVIPGYTAGNLTRGELTELIVIVNADGQTPPD